ncbi:MAG: dTDP-4-dehydrorhamnose reductase [Pseudomonadota bacterium]|nr:dTDP-4-dehydrorhamnose reductase [Pseudomonadota bacterium]
MARSLAERARHHEAFEIQFVGRPEFDLEIEEKVERVTAAHRPDVIVNAAAYTAVDRAEADIETARRINAIGPALIAREAKRAGARLVHLSTDYVYDGQSPAPYSEGAAVNPINVYGKTKLLGEEGVRAELPDEHIIIRTSWVYSPFGSNFVKTMLNLARTRETVNVVSDQVGSPTSALDLAEGLLAAIARWRIDPVLGLGETYHLAGAGQTSWSGLADRIMEVSRDCGGASARIVPISTAEYPTAAARPRFSILDSAKFRSTFDFACEPWEVAVSRVVKRLAGAAD